MHNWTPGEEITSAKLNDINPATDARIAQSEHNILELFMENYFANKNIPYQALWFDGLSDSNKALYQSGAVTSAALGGNSIVVATQADVDKFSVGDIIHLFDATHQEVHTVANKGSSLLTDIASQGTMQAAGGWTFANGGGMAGDQGIDGNLDVDARRINVGPGGSNYMTTYYYSRIYKILSGFTPGVAYTFSVKFKGGYGGQGVGFAASIYVDGNQVAIVDGNQSGFITLSGAFTATAASHTVECRFQCSANSYNWYGGAWADFKDLTVTHTAYIITTQANLTNSYSMATVKHTSATIDGANKKLTVTANVGDGKLFLYQSQKFNFPQSLNTLRCWISRKVVASYNLQNAVSADANGFTLAGDMMAKIKNGDLVEIRDAANSKRQRLNILSAILNGGNTDFTVSETIQNNFTSADFIERVDFVPKVSLVDTGAALSYSNVSLVKSLPTTVDGETLVEDEYSYTPNSPGHDLRVEVILSRNDTSLTPYAKRLGVSLNT